MRYVGFLMVSLWFLALGTPAFAADPPKAELATRHAALAAGLPANSVVVLFSEEEKLRSNDVNWPFRQNNEINYFTGSTKRKTGFALIKDNETVTTVIFAQAPNRVFETWIGRLPDFDTIKEETGVDLVVPEKEMPVFIEALLNGKPWGETPGRYLPPRFPDFYAAVKEATAGVWLSLGRQRKIANDDTAASLFAKRIRTHFPELQIRNITPAINDMREIKSPWELAQLKSAIGITVAAQKAAMQRVKTADYEYQLEAAIEFVFRDSGACCAGYPSIVAGGENATILHYDENNDPIKKNQLLLTDIGAEVSYYSADVTRTFPASGSFSAAQRAIYSAVLDAQSQAIEEIRAGVKGKTLEDLAIRVMGEHLLRLGLIEKNEAEQVRLYFLHGLGHTIGLDVHDTWESHTELRPNMVITVEPGLYIRKNDVFESEAFKAMSEGAQQTVRENIEKYDGIGVRIEDDILVQKKGYVNLSEDGLRTIEDIEAFMAR